MYSLLIADDTDDFRNALAQALRGEYSVRMCRTGREALEAIEAAPIDILVLDLMLPELDGISLLHTLASRGIHLSTLVTTRFLNDYVIAHVDELSIQYILKKPCDIRATVQRIRDLSIVQPAPAPEPADQRNHICNILKKLGIQAKHRGYELLREAIHSYLENPGQSITKELYPHVSQLCGVTATQVERSIRTAISVGWTRGNPEYWHRFMSACADDARPSNGAFIAAIADYIRAHPVDTD